MKLSSEVWKILKAKTSEGFRDVRRVRRQLEKVDVLDPGVLQRVDGDIQRKCDEEKVVGFEVIQPIFDDELLESLLEARTNWVLEEG